MISRRHLFAALTLPARAAPAPLTLPIHHILDRNAKCRAHEVRNFWSSIWPQAVTGLSPCGLAIQLTSITADAARPPSRQPIVSGLMPAALNLVITDRIPFAATNTVTHELLHALTLDILENRPPASAAKPANSASTPSPPASGC